MVEVMSGHTMTVLKKPGAPCLARFLQIGGKLRTLTGSNPQHQPVYRLATPNPLVLPVQLFREIFRIALIILIGVLLLLYLHDIGNAGPVKDLQEEKCNSQCR